MRLAYVSHGYRMVSHRGRCSHLPTHMHALPAHRMHIGLGSAAVEKESLSRGASVTLPGRHRRDREGARNNPVEFNPAAGYCAAS